MRPMHCRWVQAVLIMVVMIGAGCTTVDPYTRESKTSHTTRGSLIGAAAGAGAGALTGVATDTNVARNALIGAGVGGLGGAAVGYYMDRQEAILRQRLDETGVRISRNGNTIELIMPGHITFKTDSARIAPRFKKVLADVGLVLEEFRKTYVRVEGHTDSRGPAPYNRRLSQKRAQRVIENLRSRGIMDKRFIRRAMGESSPVASNRTAAGRRQNRRVELELIPHTEP